MCIMKTWSRSPLVPMWFIYITIQVLDAQEIKVQPEVTGYLGHDVTLPCQFIPGQRNGSIVEVRWKVKSPEEEKDLLIIIFNPIFGITLKDTFLKERVEMAEQSLIIRDVEMRDAGLYTCSITSFPSGSFEGATNLVVQEHVSMLPRMIAAGVFVLIVVTMFATTYFIIIRLRREASVRYRVCTDTVGPVICD